MARLRLTPFGSDPDRVLCSTQRYPLKRIELSTVKVEIGKELNMRFPIRVVLQPAPLWNFAKSCAGYLASNVSGRPFVWGLPVFAMIETTNRCNLRCPLCPTGTRLLKRPFGSMTLNDFETTLNQLGPQLRVLAFWNQGEPTLNPALPEMIGMACQRGIYTIVSTNGTLLWKDRMGERLVASGLCELIISIEGITPQSYEVYRVGGKLEQVIKGIQAVRKARVHANGKTPRLVLQWFAMKHNESELPRLRDTARSWGVDCLTVKTTWVSSNDQAEQFLPKNESLSRYSRDSDRWIVQRRRSSCHPLWFSTTIDWDGTVVPCCFDRDEQHAMGNVLHQDFRSIWLGGRYQTMRSVLLRQGRILEICRNCGEGLRKFHVGRNQRKIKHAKSFLAR